MQLRAETSFTILFWLREIFFKAKIASFTLWKMKTKQQLPDQLFEQRALMIIKSPTAERSHHHKIFIFVAFGLVLFPAENQAIVNNLFAHFGLN